MDALENCQEFNVETFSSDATAASGNMLRMHVINSTGENVCKPSPCSPNPCQNNGACTEAPDTSLGYTCTCIAGWEGENCQTDVDECVINGEHVYLVHIYSICIIYTYIHTCAYIHLYMYIHTCAYIHLYMYICILYTIHAGVRISVYSM